MRRPRHAALVEKAIDACIAAIEIYNKPDFRYREDAISERNHWIPFEQYILD